MSKLGSVLNASVGLGVSVATAAAVYTVRSRRAVYSSVSMRPPVLEKRPHMVPFGAVPGQNRGANPMEPILYIEDPYYYVRDDTRKNEEVLEHLRQENAYTDAKTAHLATVRDALYDELLSHVQETDEEVPYPHGPYVYYTRTVKGSSHKLHCRKSKTVETIASEELLLDENVLAVGHTHCDVSGVLVSPDHLHLAFMVDYNGSEVYSGFIKDLTTGELLKDRLDNISNLVWGNDASEMFYATRDETHRENKIWRHKVRSSERDECLFTEDDERFHLALRKTRDGKYIQCIARTSETTEIWILDLGKPSAGLQLVAKREKGVRYSLDHRNSHFYIVTNKDKATNFKIMRTRDTALSSNNWCDVFPHDIKVSVEEVYCFERFFVISGRENGVSQLWIAEENDNTHIKCRIKFNEESYSVKTSINRDFDTTKFRLVYSSMTTPRTTYDFDTKTKQLVFLKEDPCLNYDRALYQSERIEATAADGTKVPISLVYRRDLRTTEPQPLHLYGYGAYGACSVTDPNFDATILPLLDRGVVYAVAHIRGGGELGRAWYEAAKYTAKINTFTDFITCAEHLITTGITRASMMTCEGLSAGGLLISAVLNMRPDLFVAAIAGVPFVDLMNTLSDASIPLTTYEWEELGNPNEAAYFQYMLNYSPYDNVNAQAYPNILVISGLYDPRVAYWEPTKWVARLRDLKCDDNDVLLKTDLAAGHFSASDRYQYLRDKAFNLAFLLDHIKRVPDTDRK